MAIEKQSNTIRAKVICLFRDGKRILVGDAFDPTKKELFYWEMPLTQPKKNCSTAHPGEALSLERRAKKPYGERCAKS